MFYNDIFGNFPIFQITQKQFPIYNTRIINDVSLNVFKKDLLRNDWIIVLPIPSSCLFLLTKTYPEKHISHINKTGSRNTGVITKLRHTLPQSVLPMLYNTLILLFLSYCNIVWANGWVMDG